VHIIVFRELLNLKTSKKRQRLTRQVKGVHHLVNFLI